MPHGSHKENIYRGYIKENEKEIKACQYKKKIAKASDLSQQVLSKNCGKGEVHLLFIPS